MQQRGGSKLFATHRYSARRDTVTNSPACGESSGNLGGIAI
jgi:hypothetical protein